MSDFTEIVREKNKIKETIFNTTKVGENFLVHTELKLMLVNKEAKPIWVHDFHRDIIHKININGNKIDVKEFNGDQYSISLDTGKL